MTALPDDRTAVVAVGSAIVDLLALVDDQTLAATGLEPGTMTLIDRDEADRLWSLAEGGTLMAGGSAANTCVGVAALGAGAALVGRVGGDELGAAFQENIVDAGVAFRSHDESGEGPTGRCLILVTPDGQRTMRTFLGVAPMLEPRHVDDSLLRGAAFVYLEGYLWDAPSAGPALSRAIEDGRRGGAQIALSLSDPGCVERHREEWTDLLTAGVVDVLFANEQEVLRLTGAPGLEAAAQAVSEYVRTAALTRGAEGSLVVSDGRTITVEAHPVTHVVDTTGAGDLYAAGFMVGATRGLDPEHCARLGGLAAADVISALGARPHGDLLAAARAGGLL